MFNEKIIQISGNRALTNKGRIFEQFTGTNGLPYWIEIDTTDIRNKETQIPRGKTEFIENISPKEKFNNSKSIDDLLT